MYARYRFQRQAAESSGVCWRGFRSEVPEGSGAFRCGLPPCSHVIVLILFCDDMSIWVKPPCKTIGGDVVKYVIRMIYNFIYL